MPVEFSLLGRLDWHIAIKSANRLIRVLFQRDHDPYPGTSEDEKVRSTVKLLRDQIELQEQRPLEELKPDVAAGYARALMEETDKATRKSIDMSEENRQTLLAGVRNLWLEKSERAQLLEELDRSFQELLARSRSVPPAQPEQLADLRAEVWRRLRTSSLLPIVNDLRLHIQIDEAGNSKCVEKQKIATGDERLTKLYHSFSGDPPVTGIEEIGLEIRMSRSERKASPGEERAGGSSQRPRIDKVNWIPLVDQPESKTIVAYFDPPIEAVSAFNYTMSWRWPSMWVRLVKREVDSWSQRFEAARTIPRVQIRFSLHPSLPMIKLNANAFGEQKPLVKDKDKLGYYQYLWQARDVAPAAALEIQLEPS